MELVSVSEEANSRRVRLFRWNEKLRKNGVYDRQALFVLRITNKFITINTSTQEEITQRMSRRVVSVERIRLLSDDSIKSLALDVVHATNQFLPNTVLSLADQISSYLNSRFCFSPQNLLRRNVPRIVIVVEVDRTRTANYGCCTTFSDQPIPSPLFPPPSPSPECWWDSSDDEIDEELLINDYDTYEEPIYDWDEDPDLLNIMCTLGYYLGERGKYPLKPIATDEPVGFFEVDPEKEHVWLRTKDNGPKGRSTAVMVGVCPICLDVMSTDTNDIMVETCCLHVFHKRCISRWLSKSNSCPTCRLQLLGEITAA